MMEKDSKREPYEIYEDEIDLYELWLILAKHKRKIFLITIGLTFVVAIYSLFMPNIYRSKATILPVQPKQGGGISSILSRYGGLAEMAGLSLPSFGGSSSEIIILLNSYYLKAELIKRYNLLPVLFHEQWDEKNKTWKKPDLSIIARLKSKIFSFLSKNTKTKNKDNSVPSIDDGIRVINSIMNVKEDKKFGTITISIDYPDPEMAAKMVRYVIDTLRSYMSEEAIRIAEKTKKLLEQELVKTSDPTIQQKLYALIARQVETITMAKVNENFAFKIIDPPRVPDRKYKPKRKLMVSVAFVSGLFLSIFMAFFIEYVKNVKQRHKEELE